MSFTVTASVSGLLFEAFCCSLRPVLVYCKRLVCRCKRPGYPESQAAAHCSICLDQSEVGRREQSAPDDEVQRWQIGSPFLLVA